MWRRKCRAARAILEDSTYNAAADDLHALGLLWTDLSLLWLMDLGQVVTTSAQALLLECAAAVRAKVTSIRPSVRFGQVVDLWLRWCDELLAELREENEVRESLGDSHRRLYKNSAREGEEEKLFPIPRGASSTLRAEIGHRTRSSSTACMRPGCLSGIVKSLITSHNREGKRSQRPRVNV